MRRVKFINWRYPDATVLLRSRRGPTFEKSIRRALGVMVGEMFLGVTWTYPAAFYSDFTGLMDQIDRLQVDCAEAYQVIGSLAINPLPPDHRDISRALDNMSAAASGEPRPHNDLLPFPRQP